MPFDALFLTHLCAQLDAGLRDARIDKIHMPARDEVILSLRTPGEGSRRLLIAAGMHPRVNFTASPAENPSQPPMFCMLLRKHLTGARILSLTQPPMERLVIFNLDCRDELGRPCGRRLIVELVPRRSNIILTDQDGLIIDCLNRVDMEMSRRQVLPGLFYRLPPAPEKADPLSCSRQRLDELLGDGNDVMRGDKLLLDRFMGLSPALCAELAYRAEVERIPLAQAVDGLKSLPGGGYILYEDNMPSDFSLIPFTGRGTMAQHRYFEDLSQLLEAFYGEKTRTERLKNISRDVINAVKNARDRAAKRLEMRKQELTDAMDRESFRVCGDIITSNIYRMSRGQNKLMAENFYEEGSPEIEIKLDPLLTPQQNAARYYKEYSRKKAAEKHLTRLIAEDETMIAYLDSVLDALYRAGGEADISEIRTEIREAGVLKASGTKKEARPKPLKPLLFTSPNGFEVYVGKNNRQNDQLTFKMAGKNDLWFHTQKIHGSHVILFCRGRQPEPEDMQFAAELAAGHSQGAEGRNIPVDCTAVRYVKKAPGAKPGMVVYDNYKTYFVNPRKT